MVGRRPAAVYVILITLTAAMILRVFYLSQPGKEQRTAGAGGRYEAQATAAAVRGNIYDYNLTPFLKEERQYAAFIEPQYFVGRERELNSLIGVEADSLTARTPPLVVTLKKPVEGVEGITCYEIPKRYPSHPLCVHTIGYTDKGGETGLSGVERAFDDYLKTGETIRISYTANALRGSIEGPSPYLSGDADRGNAGIRLTLDRGIQAITDKVCDELMDRGAVVVVEVKTGFIKAISSRPDFSPDDVALFLDGERSELLNRAFSQYSLGSIFKTAVAAAAIESGVSEDFSVYCPGFTDAGGVRISCHKASGHRLVSMGRGFALSCNTYFINLALSMGGTAEILSLATKLGFGQGYSFGPGLMSAPGNLPAVSGDRTPAVSANTAIGQGELLATPLQVADMMCTVANGGIRRRLNLLYSKVNSDLADIEILADYRMERVMGSDTAQRLSSLLREVVVSGTGKRAEIKGVGSAGKTSSAETGGDEVHGWFAGFFPYDAPQYVISVFCENGRTGGGSAIPIFAAIGNAMLEGGYLE